MSRNRWIGSLRDALAGCIGLALMKLMAVLVALPIAAVPFACSVILIIAHPESETSQPRSVVCGHVLCALSGFVAVLVLSPSWWTLPAAIGLAIFLMQFSRTMHPPAGLTAVITATQPVTWQFIISPVLVGALVLVCLCYLYFRYLGPRRWPVSWR